MVSNTFDHSSKGAPEPSNMGQTMSKRVRLILSATPFDCGEYAAVVLCSMPRDLTYSAISSMYSVPRSVRSSLILCPLCRSAHAWYSLNAARIVEECLLDKM